MGIFFHNADIFLRAIIDNYTRDRKFSTGSTGFIFTKLTFLMNETFLAERKKMHIHCILSVLIPSVFVTHSNNTKHF